MKSRRTIAMLIGDGMGDYPLRELGGRTPLQAARIPNIRRLAAAGTVNLVKTVPDGLSPGSDVAILSLMGFDPGLYYTGRAPIEAAGAGLDMSEDDVAFRCNLISTRDGLIADHSADHITTGEARPYVEELNRVFARAGLRFHVSSGYRHLLIWRNGPAGVKTTPPHDVLGQPALNNQPSGPRSDELLKLMNESARLFDGHPLNRAREAKGRRAVSQIWLWGQGRRTALPSFSERYDLDGGVISAVDLLHGIGRLSGLEIVKVPGATGFTDTNYRGKVDACMDLLDRAQFALVHVEAPDECGHLGDLKLKIAAIEAFDREVAGPVWQGLERRGRPYTLMIATDHLTPISVRNHTREPVPIAVLRGPAAGAEAQAAFDESAGNGCVAGMAFDFVRKRLSEKEGACR